MSIIIDTPMIEYKDWRKLDAKKFFDPRSIPTKARIKQWIETGKINGFIDDDVNCVYISNTAFSRHDRSLQPVKEGFNPNKYFSNLSA